MFSQEISDFILLFKSKLDKCQSKNPWYESNQLKTLVKNMMQNIKQNLVEDNDVFHNYVYNIITNLSMYNYDVNHWCIQSAFMNVNYISDKSKSIISQHLNILSDDYYYIFDENEYDKSVLYLHKLLIPVFEIWRTSNFSDIKIYTDELDKLLEQYNIKYMHGVDMLNYTNKIMYSQLITTKNKQIIKLIKFFQNQNRIIDDNNDNNDNNDDNDDKKDKKKKDDKKDNDKKDKKKKDGKKEEINNVEYDIKTNKQNLDLLKIAGLRELCKNLNLITNKCSKRSDYIDILINYYGNQ